MSHVLEAIGAAIVVVAVMLAWSYGLAKLADKM